ncbi:MAG: hypothetical protein WC091_01655 [Sulfuricellaceae bacterium]
MIEQATAIPTPTSVRAPDPILAELWEIKRQPNAEAGYNIDVLARMAHEATERIDFDRSKTLRRNPVSGG